VRIAYIPWLFDSKEAWDRTVSDPRFKYGIPFEHFMVIYQEHRTAIDPSRAGYKSSHPNKSSGSAPNMASSASIASHTETDSTGAASELLHQSEIDALIAAI
jgi:flavorubredoxin